MMIELKVPALSESVSEGTLLSWLKQEGEAVAPGRKPDRPRNRQGGAGTACAAGGGAEQDIEAEWRGGAPRRSAGADRYRSQGDRSCQERPARSQSSRALSPSVRKLAAEHDLDPAQIAGSGRGGRVTREDVLAQLEKPALPHPPVSRRKLQRQQ